MDQYVKSFPPFTFPERSWRSVNGLNFRDQNIRRGGGKVYSLEMPCQREVQTYVGWAGALQLLRSFISQFQGDLLLYVRGSTRLDLAS